MESSTTLDLGIDGVVSRTLGGFWRAYNRRTGSGIGPFFSRDAAIDWLDGGKYRHPAALVAERGIWKQTLA